MHQAHAGVGHHVRLSRAPLRQRGGPLARAPDLEHAPAEGDRVAVHEAGDNRRQLARDDRDHRLVEEPQPGLDAAPSYQRVTLLLRHERDQVGVAEALALEGPRRRRRRARAGAMPN
jgi:hypothetical protein